MKKRITPFLLLIIFLFNTNIVYGGMPFTDVGENYWAYDYISKVIDLGLMDGYEDGTFKPNEAVNTAEALVYIIRLMKIEKDEIGSIREHYDSLVDNDKLTEEEKVAIAVALEKEFIDEEFIQRELFNEEGIKKATKLEISKYVAKAMGFVEEDYDKSLIFAYNDAKDIPEQDKPYVKFLIDEGILDKKGDENRNFNPYENITRAILAKMLSKAYDAINGKSIIEVEKITEPEDDIDEIVDAFEETTYEEISGTILMIQRNFIILDSGEKIDSYMVTEDTQVIIDGENSTIEDLEENMDAKLSVSQDRLIDKIEVETSKAIEYWTIYDIYLGENPYIAVNDEDGYIETFDLYENTKVVLDGRESYLFSLDVGDKINIEILDDGMLIIGESKDGKVIGNLKDKIIGEETFLLVEREDGTIYEYKVNIDATINRDFSRASVSDLREFDNLILTIEDGEIKKIEAYSLSGEDKGYVRGILISDKSAITIERLDGTMVEYPVSHKAVIKKDNIILDIYSIRLGDLVNLTLKSYEIVNLTVEKIPEEN